jgi:hypothetical protein
MMREFGDEVGEFWIGIMQGRGQLVLDTYHTGKRSMNSGYVSYSPFVLFLLVIVLSVPLRYADSDYPFGIFELFFESLYHIYPEFTGQCGNSGMR